jgi:ADP-dependent NAD(P)H-hydrate dehydratase
MLTARAALRAGAGVLQMACHPDVVVPIAVAMPEAKVIEWPRGDDASEFADAVAAAQAIVVGPGLDNVDHARDLSVSLVERGGDAELLVDAYALGALAREPDLVRDRWATPVLTPNATEAAVLLGSDESDELGEACVRIAERYHAVVSLRGHVADWHGNQWREEGGHAGLGTAGSGDVFVGLAAGLLARGADPAQALCWASHLHAAAGQRLAERLGRVGFLAGELADEIPHALTAEQV